MRTKCVVWIASTGVTLLNLSGAVAATLIVDPGMVGPIADNRVTLDLHSLNGMQFPADETLVEIRFAHEKYLSLDNLADGDNFHYLLSGVYSPMNVGMGLADGGDGDYGAEYYVIDDVGQRFSSWDSASVGGQGGRIGIRVDYGEFLADLDGARIRSLYLGIDATQSFQFGAASLDLELQGLGMMHVGQLPEPAALLLALAAILGARKARTGDRRKSVGRIDRR